MGQKEEGAAVSLSWGGAGSPSNTIWPGLRSTSILSGILIHAAIWPQQTCAEHWGGLFPFGERAGSPSNTVLPGLSQEIGWEDVTCFVLSGA